MMELLEMLHSPSREFTPIPFWFLNDDLTDEGIRGQLADFAAHGVYGVVLHPRMGLPQRIGYLSKTFFHYICTAVQAAAELDMKVVLYDEGMYPSGSAGGQVVAGHPELASEGITLTREILPEDEVLCRLGEDLVQSQDRDREHESSLYFEDDCGQLDGFLAGSWYLVVRKSGGTMRGLHWGEDDGEPGAPPTADILNPKAVDRFIELTHEAYYRELKAYFGTTIIGFFTDEPSILGRNVKEAPSIERNALHLDGAVEAPPRSARRQNAPSIERNAAHLDGAVGMLPWTHGFAEEFEAAGGSLEGLTALFLGIENDDTRLYHRLILQRECDVYYGKLSAWCEAHGIALMGHPHQSDDIEVQRYFHVPGQDLVGRRLGPEKSGIEGLDSTMAKCSADAARLLGRRRNSNECFGDCNKDGNPWNLSGGDLKWYLDWLAVRGVNLFIPHAFYYSVEGKRSGERPPDVGRNNIWWPHYHLWSDYMSRLSALMTDTELIAPVAVLCRNRALCPETVAPLYERQIGFQYIPESAWKDLAAHLDGAVEAPPRSARRQVAPSIERNAAHLDGAVEAPPRSARRQVAPSIKRNALHLDGAVEIEKKELILYGRQYAVVLGDDENHFPGVPHEICYKERGFLTEKTVEENNSDGEQKEEQREEQQEAREKAREESREESREEAWIMADSIADCICDPPVPDLRCAHFLHRAAKGGSQLPPGAARAANRGANTPPVRLHIDASVNAGTECWFLVNEGDQPITTNIELSSVNGGRPQYVGQYDLWADCAYKFSAGKLQLEKRESLLLFACTEEEYRELSDEPKWHILPCPKLTCVYEDTERVRKIYAGKLCVKPEEKLYGQLKLLVDAEEMAELSVNGKAAGVSFWSPHSFHVSDLVCEGENEIWLTVTGSLANRYGRPVPYGKN